MTIKSFSISTIVMIFFCFSFKPSFAQSIKNASEIHGIYVIYGEHGKYIISKVDTVLYKTYISGKLLHTVVPYNKDKKDKVTPRTTRPLCTFIYKDSTGKIQEVILPCKE